jgi:hypothetical protein
MDTLKDKTALDNMAARGQTPWTVWQKPSSQRLVAISR